MQERWGLVNGSELVQTVVGLLLLILVSGIWACLWVPPLGW
ncbi:MAG: hypothetical protein PVG25_04055 [Anaerolineae bacterium]